MGISARLRLAKIRTMAQPNSPTKKVRLGLRIGRKEVLLPINHNNYNFREKKNISQVMKERENLLLMSLLQQSKWIFWLPGDKRKTSFVRQKPNHV